MQEVEFTRQVAALRDGMFRYARSLLIRTDEAQDVVHDLLERLWRERDRLDGCRNLTAFRSETGLKGHAVSFGFAFLM